MSWATVVGAGIGLIGNSMGSDGQTVQNSVPPEFSGLAGQAAQRGEQIGGMPYTPYPYSQVADFNPYQYMGFDMSANAALNNPLPGQAQQALSRQLQGQNQAPVGANPYTGAMTNVGSNQYTGAQSQVGSNPYMGATSQVGNNAYTGAQTQIGQNAYAGSNPYLEGIIGNTLGDMSRQFNLNVAPTEAANALRSGSFGNANLGERQDQNRYDLAKAMGQVSGNLRFQDYTGQQALAENAINRGVGVQQADFARNAGLAEAGLNRGLGAQQADFARNAGLSEAGLNRGLGAQQADLSRNAGLVESGLNRGIGAQQTDLARNAGLMESMFGRGQNAFAQNQQGLFNALGQAPNIYNLGQQPGQTLQGIGGTMQQQGQNVLNSFYNQFQESQNWPFKTYQAMLAPFGQNIGSQQTTSGGGNPVAGMLGGAMLGNQIGKGFQTPTSYSGGTFGQPNNSGYNAMDFNSIWGGP